MQPLSANDKQLPPNVSSILKRFLRWGFTTAGVDYSISKQTLFSAGLDAADLQSLMRTGLFHLQGSNGETLRPAGSIAESVFTSVNGDAAVRLRFDIVD